MIGLVLAAIVALGTLVMNTPEPVHYEQRVEFTYHLPRRQRDTNAALLCWQTGAYNLILDMPLGRTYDGTFSFLIANGQGGVNTSLTPLDYSQPATCSAYVFKEPQSANATGAVLTNVVTFAVTP